MINRLIFRNAQKSIKDYFLYLITMIIISALMFAFNSMIFSKDVTKLCSIVGVMAAMIALASVFIAFVVAWLINYMINFIMEKKSKEFGIYLLLGMKKKEISSIFIKENALIGILAFFLGILPGMFLQQVFTTIFYNLFDKVYSIKIDFSIYSFILTFILYLGIYFLALLKNKKKLNKLTIRNMINFDKKNQNFNSKNKKLKIVFFFLSVIYFLVFDVMLFNDMFSFNSIWVFIAILILAIYLFYIGISALVMTYIKNGRKGILKNEQLFLLRQFASKVKTMQFTMATLTIIFVFAILGGTVAMMFNDYMDKRLNAQLPFDIIIFNDNVNYDFKEELNIINENTKINDKFIYNIYEDGTDDINMYLRNEFKYFKNVESEHDLSEYFDYDTYMKISDYNRLRKMLGYKEVTLSNNGYIIQAKENIIPYVEEHLKDKPINKNGSKLSCEGLYTEPFAQRGQNGADYIIVIPDKIAETMKLFYSLLAVDIEGESPDGLQEKLSNVKTYYDERGIFHSSIIWGYGTEQIITCIDVVLVQTNLLNDVKFVLTAISFPFIYIGLVFVCVALTILSVQQISDSSKYNYRYSVLSKLGLNEREINRIILKQLLIYYLVPLITAVGISSTISLYISEKFIYYTLVKTSVFLYYGISIFILLIVYIIYFVVTYIEFKRGIHKL